MRKNYPIPMVYLFIVLAMFFWGISFVWVTQAFEIGFRPISVVFLRLVIASIVLTIVSFLFKNTEKIQKKDYKLIFFLAFAEPFCYFLGEKFGMLYVTATTASIMVATIPLITPIFAWIFLQERVSVLQIAGFVISFMGVMFLVVDNLNMGGEPIGFILMFIAVLSGTAYGIILKKLTCNYNALTITKYQTIIGMLLFMPLFFIFDTRQFFSLPVSLFDFRFILLLGALPSSVSFTFLTIGVHHLGTARTYIFSNLIPVFTAVIAFYVLKESFTAAKLIAMIIVILGLVVSQIKRKK
jgi:drug/metabolite transporter (DMT)-like permease